LAQLSEPGSLDRAVQTGDRLLLELEFSDVDAQTVANAFGPDFERAVFALEPGAWRGPIRSGYGLHLVRVSTLQAAQARPFAEVRGLVLEEWRREQEKLAAAQFIARLRNKYELVVDESVKPLIGSEFTTSSAKQ
jgi:parvulin-like peptidyl-prolyl isomerase